MLMKSIRGMVVSLSLLATAFSGAAGAQTSQPVKPERNGGGEYSPSFFCGEKMLRHDLDFLVAPIKSQADLKRHLNAVESFEATSPLTRLSRDARHEFVASVTFNDKGITGYRTDTLEKELTVSQIYQVLSLFGQQRNTSIFKNSRIDSELDREIMNMYKSDSSKSCDAGDYEGYKCESRGTCTRALGKICTSNC